MTLIKICGITRAEDAAAIAPLVDFIGFNFWPKSKRYVTPDKALELARAAREAAPLSFRGGVKLVGVFVDADPDEVIATAMTVPLDRIQLHGDEPDGQLGAISKSADIAVWKAMPARRGMQIGYPSAGVILLDTPSEQHGGTGITFDWTIAADVMRAHPELLIMLAGGLTPENVASAIAAVHPWAVDVASGVESSPGVKDLARVEQFIAAARR